MQSDEAVVGLMAKHIITRRQFPIFIKNRAEHLLHILLHRSFIFLEYQTWFSKPLPWGYR
jgi:hypothetical protein